MPAMADTAINDLLNDLLVAIYRSLVQYADDVSPWASDKAAQLQQEVSALAIRQRSDVGRLAELLVSRDEAVDFSFFPHEFTSLHFVSLDYLAARLVEGQRQLVQRLESSADGLAADAEAQTLIQSIAASQREGLVQLLAAVPGN